jgi:endonuclease YncB( thermonuclease family)
MAGQLAIFWTPAGITLDSLGSKRLIDLTDGDTPNIRMPIRMLSIDTPETYPDGPRLDAAFAALVPWIESGRAPIEPALAEALLPKLRASQPVTRHKAMGERAKKAFERLLEERLTRPDGSRRTLFLRTADQPFDKNGRLLAYVAPNYSKAELEKLSRRERATFNLLLVEEGWAVPFVLYPSIPGERDLPLLHAAARRAIAARLGIWSDPTLLLPYELRALERLLQLKVRLDKGEKVPPAELWSWTSRYCADMTTRLLYRPQRYFEVAPEDRLFIWPEDVRDAVGKLGLAPAPSTVAVG